MDEKNLQDEDLELTQVVLDNATPKKEASDIAPDNFPEQPTSTAEVAEATEVVDTTVMPKVEFVNNIQTENIVTVKVEQKKKNGLAIASMVCGIVGAVFAIFGICGLCCCCWPITIPASICAIVFAFIDRAKNKTFCGMTIAGLICGIIGIIVPIAVLIFDFFLTYGGDFSAIQEDFWNSYYDAYEQFQ